MSEHVDGAGEMGDTSLERELYATRAELRLVAERAATASARCIELERERDAMRTERDRFAHEASELRSQVDRLKQHVRALMRERGHV